MRRRPRLGCLISSFLLLTPLHLARAEGGSVSTLAYNVLYEGGDAQRSLDAIERADADIACLTELTRPFVRAFEQRLKARYPHRVFRPRPGTWGVGIASKHPVTASELFPVKPHRIPALETRVKTAGGAVLVSCVHLFPPVGKHRKSDGFFETMKKNEELRHRQAKYLVSRYAKEAGPMLLLGDMNEGSDGKALAEFQRAGFRRSCEIEEEDCGKTFPGATYLVPALWEIDHVLGRNVKFEAAKVIREGGSDHFPVFAKLRL